ncbi:MAG: TetR family transcriptional regulator [Rhodospirillaceae bacterium]|nr:TetR family transcriptional regulator [Rhodospirillaceae bacterium]
MPREPKLDRVLSSAARLFAEDGFAATSVRAVAERARLTKAGLYYHIKEKEDLLYKICEQSIADILDGARAALARESDPAAQLAALIRNHAEYFFRHPHNLTVLNRDMGALTGQQREAVKALESAYLDLIRGVFRAGQRGRRFRRLDPTVSAFGLLAVLNTLDRWYDAAGAVKPKALVEQIETFLLHGFVQDDGK